MSGCGERSYIVYNNMSGCGESVSGRAARVYIMWSEWGVYGDLVVCIKYVICVYTLYTFIYIIECETDTYSFSDTYIQIIYVLSHTCQNVINTYYTVTLLYAHTCYTIRWIFVSFSLVIIICLETRLFLFFYLYLLLTSFRKYYI